MREKCPKNAQNSEKSSKINFLKTLKIFDFWPFLAHFFVKFFYLICRGVPLLRLLQVGEIKQVPKNVQNTEKMPKYRSESQKIVKNRDFGKFENFRFLADFGRFWPILTDFAHFWPNFSGF